MYTVTARCVSAEVRSREPFILTAPDITPQASTRANLKASSDSKLKISMTFPDVEDLLSQIPENVLRKHLASR